MLSDSPRVTQKTTGRPAFAVDMEREARLLVENAREEARVLLAEARHAAETLLRERLQGALALGHEEGWVAGHEKGRMEGRIAAMEEAREELAGAARTFSAAAKALAEVKQAVCAEAEVDLVRLAATIAAKLSAHRFDVDHAAAREAIKEAISLAADRTEVRVRLNPAEYAALEPAREELRDEFPEIVRIAFEPDRSVAPGGCRVLTVSATVDGSLDSRAARVAELLLAKGRNA
jgi:flagellar assembly protein FliH